MGTIKVNSIAGLQELNYPGNIYCTSIMFRDSGSSMSKTEKAAFCVFRRHAHVLGLLGLYSLLHLVSVF